MVVLVLEDLWYGSYDVRAEFAVIERVEMRIEDADRRCSRNRRGQEMLINKRAI